MRYRTNITQRGLSLIEALVSLSVLTLGMIGALRLQHSLSLHSDIAHQRTEALRLAQASLESLRSFNDHAAFDAIATHPNTHAATQSTNTAHRLTRTVQAADGLMNATVQSRWVDRGGVEQFVQLQAAIARVAPIYSAALAIPPQDRVLATRRNLPAAAVPWSSGRSLFKPTPGSTVAWLIDDATGVVSAQCAAPAGLTARELTARDLSACTPMTALLVRGYIRFSLGATPVSDRPMDAPLALTLGPSTCELDVRPQAREPHIAYHCVVPAGSLGAEPLRIVPEGWAFGASAETRKACRYRAAPANYLVIRGDLACPGADTQHNGGSHATTQHQP